MSSHAVSYITKDDISPIAALEAELFSDGWGENAISACIGNEDCVFLTLKKSGQLCAYICAECAADCAYISKVATAPAHRRQGFAMRLLGELEALCKSKGICELSLEVRASNTGAHRLYENAGFSFAGKRPHGYDHPTEDAMVYIKTL